MTSLGRIEVVDLPKESPEHVMLGTTVTFLMNGEKQTWSILGYGEEDVENNIVSYKAPLARALMIKKVGDEFEAKFGIESKKLKILNIELWYE